MIFDIACCKNLKVRTGKVRKLRAEVAEKKQKLGSDMEQMLDKLMTADGFAEASEGLLKVGEEADAEDDGAASD